MNKNIFTNKRERHKVEKKRSIKDFIADKKGKTTINELLLSLAIVSVLLTGIILVYSYVTDNTYKSYISSKPISINQVEYGMVEKVGNYSIVITKDNVEHLCLEIEKNSLISVEKGLFRTIKVEKNVSYFDIKHQIKIDEKDISRVITLEDKIADELPLNQFDNYSDRDRPNAIDREINQEIKKLCIR